MMFDQMGGQPSASAFTSPGMDPQQLARLMAMQQGQMAPGMMGPPPGGMPGMGGAPGGMPPGAPQGMPPGGPQGAPGGQGMSPLLQMLMANPELLKKLLATFGGAQGGPGMMGGMAGGMPGQAGMPGGMGLPPGASLMPR